MFMHFAGETVPIVVDPSTGNIQPAYIGVAVLGASNYIYAEATMKQELRSWTKLTHNTLHFLNGSAGIRVPANTKAAMWEPCRCEPDIDCTHRQMAQHFGAVVIPARPRKPRDRSKIEKGSRSSRAGYLLRHTFVNYGSPLLTQSHVGDEHPPEFMSTRATIARGRARIHVALFACLRAC